MQTGYDAGKKTKGVKRHVRVDTLGSMLRAVVPPASKQDRDGLACVLDRRMRRRLAGIEVVFADRGLGAEGGRGCGASRHVDAGDPATRPRADGLRRPADAPGRRAHPLLAPARQTARKGCRTPRPIRRGHDQANAKALVQIAKGLGQALAQPSRASRHQRSFKGDNAGGSADRASEDSTHDTHTRLACAPADSQRSGRKKTG